MIAPAEPNGGRPDSSNLFLVRSRNGGDLIEFQTLPGDTGKALAMLVQQVALDRGLALNLAAWIVVLADPEMKQFNRLLEEIVK